MNKVTLLILSFIALIYPFVSQSQIFLPPSASSQHEVFFADFNQDDKADLVVRNFIDGSVRIYFNLGTTFNSQPNVTSNSISVPDINNWELLFADVNGDGSADLINRNRNSGQNFFHYFTGNGFTSTANFSFTSPGGSGWKTRFQDFNGDGKADLININNNSGDIFIHLNVGGNNFTTLAGYLFSALAVPSATNSGWDHIFADVTGDGNLDFLNTYLPFVHFNLHTGNGSSFNYSSSVIIGPRETFEYQYFLSDCDGDGDADVLVHNLRTGEILAFPLNQSTPTPRIGLKSILRGKSNTYTIATNNHQIPTEQNRSLDVFTWYDVDHLLETGRPDHGWFYINPNHPNIVPSQPNVEWRTTTPLLGLYLSTDPRIIKQHAYWMAASGITGVIIDWTNIRGSQDPNEGNNFAYHDLVRNATQKLIETYQSIYEFTPPKIIIATRIHDRCNEPGATHPTCETQEDYAGATYTADDAYNLYNLDPSAFYTFYDNTTNSTKPVLLTLFHSSISAWNSSGPYPWSDNRFNNRYTNGTLAGSNYTDLESAQWRRFKFDGPFWNFYEPVQPNLAKNQNVYRRLPGTAIAEQAAAWVSIYQGYDCTLCWDGLLDLVNGTTILQNMLTPLWSKFPRITLINRFNYARGWYSNPAEGLSMSKSAHFEPSSDIGFTKYNEVSIASHDLRKIQKRPPITPSVTQIVPGAVAQFNSGNYPTEYQIQTPTITSPWRLVDISSPIACFPPGSSGEIINVKTRNAFGEAPATAITRSASLSSIADCNMNGESDFCDVTKQHSRDHNNNSIPDECEPYCQTNLGFGGPGNLSFSVCGDDLTTADSVSHFLLTGGTPFSTIIFVMGGSVNPTQINGGTVVPTLDNVIPLTTDALGNVSIYLKGTGGPSIDLYMQFVSISGPAWHFSNAIRVRLS